MSATRPEIDVHPKTLLPSSLTKKTWEVIIIGAGPAGEMAAARCVRGGLTTLLVESELVGGECPYWACVPSKALLRPSETIEAVRAVSGARERLVMLAGKYGVRPEIDLEGTWARRDHFSKGWNDEAQVQIMQMAGVDIIHGFGSIAGPKKVAIKDWYSGEVVEVQATDAVVIATGSCATIPAINGLIQVQSWTPREAVSAKEVPEHLIVVGAGAVGTELATVYNQLGSKVTLVASKVLPRFVAEAGKMVHASLERAGVVIKAAKIKSVSSSGTTVTVALSDGSIVEGTKLLIAAGRRARTFGLDLDMVGAPSNGAWIGVDESMCAESVAAEWLYAVGDANGLAPLTHMGKYQGKIAGDSIVAKAKGQYRLSEAEREVSRLSDTASRNATPQVVFTDPQVAVVGLNAAQAEAKGLKARAVSAKFRGPGVFLHAESYEGWAEWVIEEGSGRLLGATFVGRDVVDLLHASTVAVVGRMTWQQLWHAVPSFPTMGEIYTSLLEAAEAEFEKIRPDVADL